MAGESKIKMPEDSVCTEDPFPLMVTRKGTSSGLSSWGFTLMTSPKSNYLLKAPPIVTTTLGVRAST